MKDPGLRIASPVPTAIISTRLWLDDYEDYLIEDAQASVPICRGLKVVYRECG
jgi:hypothetical protein